MTDIVVLLKLVPDIRHIPHDAWDLERGTLKRNRLTLIPNAMDDRALALALRIREEWGGTVTALSMGPPRAASLCARARALGADDAVLITDQACAGSDTLATSRILARAVERIASDSDHLLVLSGMQSPDGDTAQVPVQVAAFLGASVVPYVTKATVTGDAAELTSIASDGESRARIRAHSLPAVVTCTDQLPAPPFHTSLARLRGAAATPPRIVTAADLDLAEDDVGLSGSATRVVRISVAESVRRDVDYVEWSTHGDHEHAAARLAEQMERALSGGGPVASGSAGAQDAAPSSPAPSSARPDTRQRDGSSGPSGAVWALVDEHADEAQLGILDHARRIADALGCATVACRPGARDDRASSGPENGTEAVPRAALGSAGATDELRLLMDNPGEPAAVAFALEAAAAQFAPRVLLLPASPEGRVTAPYLAARLGAGLTADCTSFAVDDFTRRARGERRTYREVLYQKRPALGGNIEATIVSPRNIELGVPQMATVRPGPTVARKSADVRTHTWSAPERAGAAEAAGSHVTIGRAEAAGARVDIERCSILVSAGRGIGGEAGIEQFARPLAEALRKRFDVDVEVAASRMVVDAGDLPRERQVGQTGKTVRPDIYVALGISGAVQHRAGMDGSAMIVSVNADAEAPIRTISDIFIHGRVQDVVPELTRALESG
jgi:electron transfer flavoprotein alpha subunit